MRRAGRRGLDYGLMAAGRGGVRPRYPGRQGGGEHGDRQNAAQPCPPYVLNPSTIAPRQTFP